MAHNEFTVRILEVKIRDGCSNIIYPQVEGLENRVVQEQINELIKRQVCKLIPVEGCSVYQEIIGNYRVTVNKKGILSIRIEFYTFKKHAANGLTVVKSITANLVTGQVYQLPDLFKINSDYKTVISRIIKKQIDERHLPLIKEFVSIKDNEEFYLTENSLVIYFQLFEYTPHYVGIPEFAIPYAQIRDLIRNEGPIGKLM